MSSRAARSPDRPDPADLPPTYDFRAAEERWTRHWLESDTFRADPESGREPYCIVIPPPNVTGSLHMGHALDNTIQDVLIRWRRMQGYETLWLPGTDHAGIATQYVVEKRLAEEGLNRQELGRERFLERVWAWKDEYEATILGQLKRLGASCDWSRTAFTLDEPRSRAVREVFVHLYRRGLIYRGEYIVNWCPRCRTTLADLEVEHEEHDGKLYTVRYPVEGGGSISVATTRPETMLGDTGVAVHPDDPRYRDQVGRTALLPVLGRRLPIVADPWVDREFGTGAVKVTPAHDPDDFELGRRHGLGLVKAIDEDARMTAEAGPYAGLDRHACREALVRQLQAEGHLEKVEPHRHAVGHCYRCETVVEPLVSRQWFVKTRPLAEPAMAAVRDGRTRIVPERFEKVYFHWLENIRDWPVSRQLWWGHRIPAWTCQAGHLTVDTEAPAACAECGSGDLVQDPDVLDTWFSSALWPFSTLGWPERTRDLEVFYPTSVLVTGYDILFFWVARMMFMGLEFMREVPFRTVFLHGLIRDAEGRKMSKSRGNAMDPLEIIEAVGADTLRWSLITGNTPGNDMRYSSEKIEGARNFANKIWNAARFTLQNLADFEPSGPGEAAAGEARPDGLELADRWILSRYRRAAGEVTRLLDRFELGEAARVLYDFVWSELCDWYIELAKARLYGDGPAARRVAQQTLWQVMEGTMRLLHPFMPFLSEDVWQRLPRRRGDRETLALAPWPAPDAALADAEAESRMELVMAVTRALRNLRSEVNLPPTRRAYAVLRATSPEALAVLDGARDYVARLAAAGRLDLSAARPGQGPPPQALAAVVPGCEIYLPLAGLVDLDREIARLEKDLAAAATTLARARQRLGDPMFRSRAPEEVVRREEQKAAEAEELVQRLKARLAGLRD